LCVVFEVRVINLCDRDIATLYKHLYLNGNKNAKYEYHVDFINHCWGFRKHIDKLIHYGRLSFQGKDGVFNITINYKDLCDPLSTNEIWYKLDISISRKFKVPKFVKYTTTQFSETHLKVYYNKMNEVIHDEKLLIHHFYKSLAGPNFSLYMGLNGAKMMK
jgi:hypothetical protein